MIWFNRLGSFFLLCLFSLQTIGSTVAVSNDFLQTAFNNKQEHFQVLHSANDQFIYQESPSFFNEKIEDDAQSFNNELNKFLALPLKVSSDSNLLSKSKSTFSDIKVFVFSSVQIIFPFHNFW